MSDEEAKKVIILHNFDRTEYIQLRVSQVTSNNDIWNAYGTLRQNAKMNWLKRIS